MWWIYNFSTSLNPLTVDLITFIQLVCDCGFTCLISFDIDIFLFSA